LRRRLNEHAAGIFGDREMVPELFIDALVTPQTLTLELVDEIAAFEPFGAGNPKPVFVTRGLVIRDEPFVMKDKHIKLQLRAEGNRAYEAVWWNGVELSKGQTLRRDTRIELAYVPEANEWQGNRRLQLVVEDLRTDN
jgi:single-stranded-DNA-specific exonuclease